MKLFNFLVGFVALGTAGCAAFFSVLGIATFLGGNFIEVAVMASFLEAGKLICASAAYRYREVAPTWIRGLFITFTAVMMFITSMGIFGFLSDGYQKAASQRDISEQRIENVQTKKESFQNRVERLEEDRERLIETKARFDSLQSAQGWLTERQDERLSQIPAELNEIENDLSAARDSSLAYQQKATNLEANVRGESKLGPILFVADAVGLPQNKAALYFICILIFVFDPMAVTLVVALSMATDFEETVTEEEPDEKEGETVLTNHGPTVGKKPNIENVRRTLSEPLPEEKESMMNQMHGESPTADERIERMQDIASLGEDLIKKDEDENSRNNDQSEDVENEQPFYPEDPPVLEAEDEEQDFEEWAGSETKDTSSKEWKEVFN